MALDAGTLEVKIIADNKKAIKEIEKVEQGVNDITKATDDMESATSENTKSMSGLFNSLSGNLSTGLGGTLKNILGSFDSIGAVGGIAIAAIGAAIEEALDVIDELNEATDKAAGRADDYITRSTTTGLSTDYLQQLHYASPFIDVDEYTVTSSMAKIERSMYSAQEGTESYIIAFEKLGVEYADADGNLRDFTQVFGETMVALGNMENVTERDAIAMALLGRSAKDLAVLFGEENYNTYLTYMQEALDEGYVKSRAELEELNKVQDALDKQAATKEKAENNKGLANVKERKKQIEAETELINDEAEAWDKVAKGEKTVSEALAVERLNDFQTTLIETERAIETFLPELNPLDGLAKEIENAKNLIQSDFIRGKVKKKQKNARIDELNDIQAAYDEAVAAINEQYQSGLIDEETANALMAQAETIGINLVNGMEGGIDQMWSGLEADLAEKCRSLINTINAIFGIHSPSRVMQATFKNVVLGMSKGVDDNQHFVIESIDGLGKEINEHVDASLLLPQIPDLNNFGSTNNTSSISNINVNVNQNNSYGSGSTLMGQHNSNRKLSTMISGAIASAM